MSVTTFTLGQLVLVMSLATSAVAQYTPGTPRPGADGGGTYGPGSGGNGGRPMGGGGRMRGGVDRSNMPTPSRVEGPPTPAVMQDTIGVTGEPLDRYAVIYANHRTATGPLRDSLRSGMEDMREAFETGGRDAARKTGADLQRQWKDLSQRDKEFEKTLKDLLSKDQQKRYEKWKKAREKAEEERFKERRRSARESRG